MAHQTVQEGVGPDEFLQWLKNQEYRHELVDGEPVMMAGANRRHDRIATSGIVALGNQLKGKPCQPFTSDTAIRIPNKNIRFPDFGVDCGRFVDDSMTASSSALVVEIFSPTTRSFDRNDKLEEYKTVESLKYIVLIDPAAPKVRLYSRDSGQQWISTLIKGVESVVEMPQLGLSLSLSELYEGLQFTFRPTLVESDQAADETDLTR